MPSLPSAQQVTSLVTSKSLQQAVGAMIPLGQISSVVQTLQNIQGFNPGQFSQITNSIQSALQGFDTASSILSNFSGNSPVGAFLNTLQQTGMAGSSVAGAAAAAGAAYQSADSFLNSRASVDSFARLSGKRPSVEESRAQAAVGVNADLRFPKDIGKYWIALNFVEANFSSIMASANPVQVKKTSKASVILPVPSNYVDQNSLEYSSLSLGSSFGSMVGAAASAAGAGLSKGSTAAMTTRAESVTNFSQALMKSAGALTGEAINTHQVLTFTQPTLKKHTFQWKLIPSSEEESIMIWNIINTIKGNIYPRADILTFDYPNLVEVYMFNGDQMYLFKPAYVEGFSVSYNPDGQAFYRNGYPSAVQIEMVIHENAVWTSQDFQGFMADTTFASRLGSGIGSYISSATKALAALSSS